MGHLYISAAHKSSGKTTLSIGLCAALRAAGDIVQPFKKGPDYIDPLWLGQAAGRPCYNLDFYTMDRGEIGDLFASKMQGADIGLIEGNKGLYDGLALDGSNSNAALAAQLDSPIILVLDSQGHDPWCRAIDPRVPGLRTVDSHRRRDPQQGWREPPRGQTAGGHRTLHGRESDRCRAAKVTIS